jgi:decaprenyl-phosphate phosphoribosyltransferase
MADTAASDVELTAQQLTAPVRPTTGRTSLIRALVKTARPRQWIKNVLVFAAPGAAASLTNPAVLARSVATFFLFCLAASGTYFLNDVVDAESDRMHPTKRNRPVAAGQVSPRMALFVAITAFVASLGLSALITPKLTAVIGAYLGMTICYSLWLKNEPVLDIGVVAGGFIMRAIAGGVAAGVPLSHWFLIVTSFGSLFMVSGKRYAEHVGLGEKRAGHRSTLSQYSLPYLRYVRSVSSSLVIVAYCLWAFQKAQTAGSAGFWFEVSIAPIVLGILRYALVLDGGGGGAPEDVVLSDRPLQVLGLVWLVTFALGLYA